MNNNDVAMLKLNQRDTAFRDSMRMRKETEQQALKWYRSVGSKILKIDVVTNYDKKVENFWERNGFNKIENVELNWAGKQLSAVTMKKYF